MGVRPIALNASLHGICMACTILLTEMPLVHTIASVQYIIRLIKTNRGGT